jgi:hypothetical protein
MSIAAGGLPVHLFHRGCVMSAHKRIVETLFRSLQTLDHNAMAACYDETAAFSDIAFRLQGRQQIHTMWHMICLKGIDVQVQSIEDVGDIVHARIVDTYTFSDTGRKVINPIESSFEFRNGLIAVQRDSCDPLHWARQAFGGLKGELVGRVGLLRRVAASRKLQQFAAASSGQQ